MSSSNHPDEEYQETKNPEVLIPWVSQLRRSC